MLPRRSGKFPPDPLSKDRQHFPEIGSSTRHQPTRFGLDVHLRRASGSLRKVRRVHVTMRLSQTTVIHTLQAIGDVYPETCFVLRDYVVLETNARTAQLLGEAINPSNLPLGTERRWKRR